MRLVKSIRQDVRLAKSKWCDLNEPLLDSLVGALRRHRLSLAGGDLLLMDGRWYVTHSGLLRIAVRKHCQGMRVQPVTEFCDSNSSRYAFRATLPPYPAEPEPGYGWEKQFPEELCRYYQRDYSFGTAILRFNNF